MDCNDLAKSPRKPSSKHKPPSLPTPTEYRDVQHPTTKKFCRNENGIQALKAWAGQKWEKKSYHVSSNSLFIANFSHLHYNLFEHGCEAISGRNCKIVRNCLTSMFKYIVMQMRKMNCEKGYSTENRNQTVQPPESENVA